MPSLGHSLCNMALFSCRFNWLNGVTACTVTLLWASTVELCATNHWFKNCLLSKCFTKLKKTAESFYSLVLLFLSMPSCWFVYIYDCGGCFPQIIFIPLFRAFVWLKNKKTFFNGSFCCCWQWCLNLWTVFSKIHFLILYLDRNMFFQDRSSISLSYNHNNYIPQSCMLYHLYKSIQPVLLKSRKPSNLGFQKFDQQCPC